MIREVQRFFFDVLSRDDVYKDIDMQIFHFPQSSEKEMFLLMRAH